MLQITIGDNANIKFTWQTGGKPFPITGNQMFFTVKTNLTDPDSAAVISKSWYPATFTDATTGITYDTALGQTLLQLLPSDTQGLTAGTYNWNLRMKSASGIVSSTNNSTLLVVQGVTQGTPSNQIPSGSIRSISANTTMLDSDQMVEIDTTSGAITVTLLSAVGRSGRTLDFPIVKGNAYVTITAAGGEKVGGSTSVSFNTPKGVVGNSNLEIRSDNTGWIII